MTIYFMGSEIASFVPADGDTFEETAGATDAFNRASIRKQSTFTYAESADFTAPDTFYVHALLYHFVSTAANSLVLYNGTTDLFRVVTTSTSIKLEANISSVWTQVGATISVDLRTPQHIDLYVEGNDATGTATLFISGTERITGVADLSAVTGITNIRSYGTTGQCHIAQVVVADEPTIGWRLATWYPSGAGATGDWTGDYTSVDEAVYNDGDFINSATANQVETFTATGPALTGYTVRAVGVYARAKRGGSGPQNLQLAIRVSGTDYFSGNKALGIGYGAFGHIWEQNPATTADWITTAISAVQPGVKSIT